ncbi:MAG: isoprenylcysteine carboxylmethyltransferase family protein [Candidatus Sericytochromatia bacterium]|nr:isoprenylcysteine carboxylmethyltransferase family protein [Candidatus Sericytochromatia bacterium]
MSRTTEFNRGAPLGRDLGRRLFQAALIQSSVLGGVAALWPAGLASPRIWVLVGVGLAANALQPTYSLREGSRTPHDRASGVQIVWTVYLVQLAAVVEWLWRRPESGLDPVSTGATLLMVGGLALRTWAVATLGRFFTWNVEVQGDQSVITAGPYRRVRHPSYTGAFMMFWGATLLLHAWFTSPLAFFALALAFRRRIELEETLLLREIPGYEAYVKQTGSMLPRVGALLGRK